MAKYNLMEDLLLKGAIVKPQISIWSAKKQLNAQILEIEEINPDLVRSGAMLLLPKEATRELNSIKSRAMRAIDQSSHKFDFGSFTPNSRLASVEAELDRLATEFNNELDRLGARYLGYRQQMLDKWQIEAVRISADKGNPDLTFKVMQNIELCFPQDWENVRGRFSFGWTIHRDMNEIAAEFIRSSVKGIVEQIGEFSNRLMERISNNDLNERNTKPVRDFLDNLQHSLVVFKNEKLVQMVERLSIYVEEGMADTANVSKGISDSMKETFSDLVNVADKMADSIAEETVKQMTSHARKIEV